MHLAALSDHRHRIPPARRASPVAAGWSRAPSRFNAPAAAARCGGAAPRESVRSRGVGLLRSRPSGASPPGAASPTPGARTGLALILKGALLIAFFAPALVPQSSLRGEEFSRDFLRAINLLQSDSAERRRDGEKMLRQLGDRALTQLNAWMARAEATLDRVRQIAGELQGSPAPQADPELDEVRRYFLRRLDEGWKLLLSGDYNAALRIAEGLEALDPDSPLIFDYRRLVSASRKRSIRGEVLDPAVEFRERVCEVGDTPAILFRLTNRLKDQVLIQARKGLLGTLEVTIERSFIGDGSIRREVRTVPIHTFRSAEDLVIPAGRNYEQDIPLPLDESLPPAGMVARMKIGGRFRPSQWGVGERNISDTLEIPETECWVVPRGQRDLALSPLRKLQVALFFKDLQALFTAGQLAAWASEQDPLLKEQLERVLIRNIDELDDIGFQIANRLLLGVSGVKRRQPTDRAFWKAWLSDQNAREPTSGE